MAVGSRRPRRWMMAIGAIAALALLRAGFVSAWASGGGQWVQSPSGRLRAEAYSYVGKRFLGGERQWADLRVVDRRERVLWHLHLEGAQSETWHAAGEIEWTADSSSVSFRLQTSDGATMSIAGPTFAPQPSVEEAWQQ